MYRARRFKKDWDGNRKRNAALRCAEHQLGECNIFMVDLQEADLSGDREAVNRPNTAPRRAVSSFMQRVTSFLLPGESYLSHSS
jgi:hypothetical protein